MRIFEGLTLFAIITSTAAFPFGHEKDESAVKLMNSPLMQQLTDGIPKYIQDIKEIIASPHPLNTAFYKIREILPERLEIPLDNDDTLVLDDNPDARLVGISIEKVDNTVHAPPNPMENSKEIPIEKSEVMGLDSNQPYQEILDWALKKLGYADVEDIDVGVAIDPVLNESDPDLRINREYGNTIDEKSDENIAVPILEVHQPMFEVNEDIKVSEPGEPQDSNEYYI